MKWKLEVFKGKQWNEQPDRMFDELLLRYLEETQARKRSAERDRYAAKQLRKTFQGLNLSEITPEKIAAYKRKRNKDGVTDSTIAKELRLFSAMFNYAKREWGWQLENVVQGRCPKEPPGRMRWISRDETSQLLETAQMSRTKCLVDFIVLALNTGMRSQELLGMEWSRVDLGHRLLYLEPEHQKNGCRSSIPINDEANEVLLKRFEFKQQHCPHSSWVFCGKAGNRVKSIKRSFKSACERAEIVDFKPHDLRHTCAAWLVQAGVPLRTVAEVLRHKDIATTMRYAHLAPENVRDAVAELSRFGHGSQKARLSEVS